ncbi:MAG: VRR-NUC domain-containing protein, partial [Sedimenticola sp.]
KQNEHQEQAALFRWAEFARARHPELELMFAIPNGGHRHKAVAARMKVEGVKRGVPDICVPVPRDGYHGLYIELKTARGTASKEQKLWLRQLQTQGYRVAVCRGWEAARGLIENYLNPTEENQHG